MEDIDLKLKLYKKMILIRQFENGALDLYSKNIIKGSIHLYIGQEATAAGVCENAIFVFGMDPITCIKELGKQVAIHNVHAQDTRINPQAVALKGVNDYTYYGKLDERSWVFKLVGYGHGSQIWTDIIDTLRLSGYDGYITIENLDALISAEEGLTKAVDFLDRIIIHKPAGERRLE